MVGWMYTIWYSDPQIHDSEEREAMKQMKRAAGLLLALVLVLSMAACGKKDGDGGDSQSGFQRGTIENGIYTNTFVGIGCQLSDDWTYYTDEQLAELSGVSRKTMERHRTYLVAILLAYTNGYEIIRGHLCQISPGKEGTV